MIDKKRIEKAVTEILLALDFNPDEEGLKKTPERVANFYIEMLKGNNEELNNIKPFIEANADSLIIIKNIPFYSICEHHLLPFFGKISVAYLPRDKKILGFGHIVKIINTLAKKLQLQERYTDEIAGMIFEKAECLGVYVIIEAEHLCVAMSGEKTSGAKITTLSAKGLLKEDDLQRREVLVFLTEKRMEEN